MDEGRVVDVGTFHELVERHESFRITAQLAPPVEAS